MNDEMKMKMEKFETMPCAISVFKADRECTIEYANLAFYEVSGYTQSEIQYKFGNRLSAFISSNSWHLIDDFITGKNSSDFLSLELALKSSNNGEVWLYAQISRIPAEDGDYLMLQSQDITEYKATEKAYTKLCQNKEYIIKYVGCDIIEYDFTSGVILSAETDMLLTGRVKKGSTFPDVLLDNNIIKEESQIRIRESMKKLKDGAKRIVSEIALCTPGGQERWCVLSLGVQTYEDEVSVIAIFSDVSAEKEAVENYLNEALFYQELLSVHDAYGHLDVTEDRLLRVGGLWTVYREILNEISFTSLATEFILKVVHEDDKKHYLEIMTAENFKESYRNGITRLGCEFRRIVELNKMMWMGITILLFEHPVNKHLMALLYLKNIDIQKKQRLLLEHEAGYDTLTQIYNKKTFFSLAKECIGQMNKGEVSAFVLVDIDDFRKLNEEQGYGIGDEVLKDLAKILKQSFRKEDVIGRFEGDTFVVLIRNLESREEIERRLKDIQISVEAMKQPDITVSIGAAFVKKYDILDNAVSKAETALYNAKNNGKNCFYLYGNGQEEEFIQKDMKPIGLEEILEEPIYYPEGIRNSFHEFSGKYGEMTYLVNPETYDLVQANQAFYDRIGKTELECRGKKCYEIIHKRDLPCPFCGKNNWTDDKFYMYRNYNEALEQEFLIKNKLVEWEKKKYLFAIAVDLSNDKNVLESLENETTENQIILNGIQRMQEADTFHEAMNCAMESVGSFFRASNARFWGMDSQKKQFVCKHSWYKKKEEILNETQESQDADGVNSWITSRRWEDTFSADNQEMMLFVSYDMYMRMKRHNFANEHWIAVRNDYLNLIGFIEINNITINMQNFSFMNSFSGYLVNEWRKRKMVENIIHNSYYDKLTGALNRTSYENYLKENVKENLKSIGVVAVNMDGLKKINENYGLQYGNECIQELAGLLQKTFGKESVFRLSGDEFLVLEKNVSQREVESGIQNVERMLKSWGRFTVSMGYSWDNIENDLDDLVEYANQVMRLNKKRYYAAVQAEGNKQIDKLEGLMEAMNNGHMVVYLQPKVNNRTNTVVGAEALIRYKDEENGVVSPGKFIPVLEQANLIRYVDLFVFEEVCRLLEKWKKEGKKCPVISLNFSRLTLVENDLLSSMSSIFEKYDADKECIEIEITESFADVGKALLNQAARKIHGAGFRISLDDFGTKYTNLTILTDIEVNVLKLDRSLVCALEMDTKNRTILKNIIKMCEELGIEVIAEGVELKEQEQILRELGCYLIQGYLYSKPVDIDEFESHFLNPLEG